MKREISTVITEIISTTVANMFSTCNEILGHEFNAQENITLPAPDYPFDEIVTIWKTWERGFPVGR